MTARNGVRAGALLAFVLAEGVAAHPRPESKPIDVRLIGTTEAEADGDAYARGKRLLAADDVVGALAAFREALRAAPDSADAMNGVGVAYDRLGRTDLARRFYQAGLEIDPASPALLNNLGYSLFLAGDRAAAIAPLRAAAASADPDAAATARATLARLAGEPGPPPADIAAPTATAHIELTNDGEQRLSFAPPAPARAVVATLGDDAAAVVVAAAWNDADDAAMVARVRAEAAAEQAEMTAARAQAEAQAQESAQAPAQPEVPPATTAVARAPQLPAADHAAEARSVRPATALVLAAADTGSRRRVRAASGGIATAMTGGPSPRVVAAFDSDDAELNAFAARVKAVTPAAAAVTGDRGRIAARFRA